MHEILSKQKNQPCSLAINTINLHHYHQPIFFPQIFFKLLVNSPILELHSILNFFSTCPEINSSWAEGKNFFFFLLFSSNYFKVMKMRDEPISQLAMLGCIGGHLFVIKTKRRKGVSLTWMHRVTFEVRPTFDLHMSSSAIKLAPQHLAKHLSNRFFFTPYQKLIKIHLHRSGRKLFNNITLE